jgi:hypothetical protein
LGAGASANFIPQGCPSSKNPILFLMANDFFEKAIEYKEERMGVWSTLLIDSLSEKCRFDTRTSYF